ncbi:MAG: sugar ABC transporter ATP-binding protein [Actinobacteria bacterium]|nr:sugar ABC transporter ATP-binding protein [Actinomycetota bacterium]
MSADPTPSVSAEGAAQAPLLHALDVNKHYGGVKALTEASLEVGHGEVHGLIGENGSGKSTLLKILSGQTLPDEANVTLDGKPLPLGNPVRCLDAGIATVTQETTLVPELSVAENIVLGRRAIRRWWGVDRRASRQRAVEVLDRLDLRLNPRTPVKRLRPDERQMVEIARAISMDARVLILDEPTSSLTDEEVDSLFGVVTNLKAHGISTIFVSHRLKEVFHITDSLTVLRDGRTIAKEATADLDVDKLIALMVGRHMEQKTGGAPPAKLGKTRLSVSKLTVPGMIEDVSFEVASGEIVGFAGLIGAGRSELLQAIFGLHASAEGTIELDGANVWNRNPHQAMNNGFALVPADRKEEGLILPMSIRENLMIARTADSFRLRRPPLRREAEELDQVVGSLRVAGAKGRGGAPIASLSGGNQQKIVLAKWLAVDPKVILLDEPTRGVDVGAKDEIYEILDRLREGGPAILVSSSETPELLRLCDRIFVMFRGRIVTALAKDDASESAIAHYATGNN